MSANDDCYFYYYSSCTKGGACPFRHEPAALAQEVMCTFWKAGNCSKPHCIYRHLDVSSTPNRKVTPCYYESQPGGCRKPHCPFLHERPKDPYPAEVTEMLEKAATTTAGKIIVNKNMLKGNMDKLAQLILPVGTLDPSRISTSESRVSVKSRLGPIATTAPMGVLRGAAGAESAVVPSIKDRLGDIEQFEVYECSENDETDGELNTEVRALRDSAIKTLDLRKRLGTKRDVDSYESDEDDNEVKAKKMKSVVKKVKKEKKDKKKKEKKEKREKKKEKRTKEGGDEQKRFVKRLSSTPPQSDDDGQEEMSLADRIAAKRDGELASRTHGMRAGGRKVGTTSPLRVTVARKRMTDDNVATERSPKKKKLPTRETEAEIPAEYSPIDNRKLKVKKSSASKDDEKIDSLQLFLKAHPEVDAAANSSLGLMKELDELLND